MISKAYGVPTFPGGRVAACSHEAQRGLGHHDCGLGEGIGTSKKGKGECRLVTSVLLSFHRRK
jgi:hypothetical protein